MKTHDLKIWPEFFDHVLSGAKTAELRKDDREYVVGDVLVLREWQTEGHYYTGRKVIRSITHVLRHMPEAGCAAQHGLSAGYVILSLKE
jgi:uncharacterized protein YqfB (UPF0267 family)